MFRRKCLLAFLTSLAVCAPCVGQSTGRSSAVNLTFTSYDAPGALITAIEDINGSGEMVGYYGFQPVGPATGFILKDGQLTTFTYEGNSTFPRGLNDSGLIAGYALVGNNYAAFTYDGTKFTTIMPPGKAVTWVFGISESGAVVGGTGAGLPNEAFETIAGKYRDVTPPPGGFIEATAAGINKYGEVAGTTTGAGTLGFMYKQGKFRILEVPGDKQVTDAWDINDNHMIVGYYLSCAAGCKEHGFALLNGKYLTIDYPSAVDTYILGVNNAGQLVGGYDYADGKQHGFYTSPLSLTAFEQPGCCKVDPNWKGD
ncbi:MAG: hypothetical protein H0X25_01380 [Acidobacteriales bacterium]|nr:hypothetical protein [Terriglobales bacterium]